MPLPNPGMAVMLRRVPQPSALSSSCDLRLLAARGLLTAGRRPTAAPVLLFADNSQTWLPEASVRVRRYQPAARATVSSRPRALGAGQFIAERGPVASSRILRQRCLVASSKTSGCRVGLKALFTGALSGAGALLGAMRSSRVVSSWMAR